MASDTDDPKAMKILLVGNSILYKHDVPKLLAQLFADSGRRSRIGAIYGPSYTLKQHWDDGLVAQALANKGKWDWLVLCENTQVAQSDSKQTEEYLDKLKALGDKVGARTMLVESYTDRPADEEDNRNKFLWIGYHHGVPVLQFGSAWNSVRNAFSDVRLYEDDRHHPSAAGSMVEAMTIYTSLVQQAPTFSPSTISILGIDTNRVKPLEIAISTALTPDFAIHAKSVRMLQAGAYTRLVDESTKSLERSPKQCIAKYYRAYAYNMLGEHQKALADWTSEAREHPGVSEYKIMRAATLSALGRYADASHEMQLVLEKDRHTFYYYNASAFFKLNAKDYTGAIADCDAALKLTEHEKEHEVADCRLTRARAEFGLARFAEARADALKCVQLDPRGCGGAAFHLLAECAKSQHALKEVAAMEAKAKNLGFAGDVFFSKPSDASAEDALQKHFKYREDTTHLSVFCNDNQDLLPGYAETAEALILPLQKTLNTSSGAYPLNVYTFDDQKQLESFANDFLNCKVDDAAGLSFRDRQCVLTTNLKSPGTAGHELTHNIIDGSYTLGALDEWAKEGLPELFSKFYGYKQNGKIVIYAGFQNQLRVEPYDTSFLQLKLEDVVNCKDWSVKSAAPQRLAAVFLFQHGRLPEYIRCVQTKNKQGFTTYYEAAFGKTFAQLEPDWQAYCRDVVDHAKEIQDYPNSRIYASKKEFDEAMRKHHIDMRHARLLTAV